MARERPDGGRAEWDVGFLGRSGSEPFPFVIADRTPREYRVTPTESVAGSSLLGIEEVVVAVHDLDDSIERFRRVFRLATPVRGEIPSFGAAVASFPGEPLTLATPLDGGSERGKSWLAERLDIYGECPCACLLGVEDLDAASEQYALGDTTKWLGRRVAWFDSPTLGRTLGVAER